MVSSKENESRKRLRQEPVEDGTPENLKPLETKKARTEENDKDEIRLKLKDIQNELSCPICTEWFLRTTTLGCGHSFCGDCIDRWLHTNLSCPLCRAPLREPPTDAPLETVTYDRNIVDAQTDNIYEAISIISKRTIQINESIKKELLDKLEEFASPTESLDEIFENKEQIEVSKFYEKLPKAHAMAIENWLKEKIYYRNTEIKE
jgi:DNA-directed RNA polymerase subunit K/omega